MENPSQQPTPLDIRRARTREWLDQHWRPDHQCPLCGTDTWNIGDLVDLPARHWPSGYVYTFMVVSCANCAFTYFLNARELGLVEEVEEAENKDAVS